MEQIITLTSDGSTVVDAALTFVCVDLKTQKALPLDRELRQQLESLIPNDQ
jgi:thioesterase-3